MNESDELLKAQLNRMEERFRFHVLSADQSRRCEIIRVAALEFAKVVATLCPGDGGYRERAFSYVHIAMMQANAAISINAEK